MPSLDTCRDGEADVSGEAAVVEAVHVNRLSTDEASGWCCRDLDDDLCSGSKRRRVRGDRDRKSWGHGMAGAAMAFENDISCGCRRAALGQDRDFIRVQFEPVLARAPGVVTQREREYGRRCRLG